MNLFEDLKLGEALELRAGEIAAKSRVERIDSETTFVITQPTHKLLPINFSDKEHATFFFFRENGIYSFKAVYVGWGTIDGFRVCGFAAVSEIEKNQRRFSYRLPVILDMSLRRKNRMDQSRATEYSAKTVNISQEGILFSCRAHFDAGDKVMLEINLSEKELCILSADILRCELPLNKDDPYMIAGRFCNMTKRDQAQIAKFILNRQILDRKRRQGILDTR